MINYFKICIAKIIITKIINQPRVQKNNFKASFFWFSIYIKTGLPKIKAPVMAADKTKRSKIKIGPRIV